VYNPLDIAHAIPLVLDQVPEAQFVIRTYAYDTGLLARFQSIIEEHRAAHAVHYVGPLPGDRAIADLYRLADVAVSVPSSDGTPISVLEALACGLPVVLSDVPSLREWVQHGREGLFAPAGDVQAISANVVRLLTDDALRQTLSENGTRLVRERADREFWMRHSEEIYQRLIEDRPA
jgi:glycosyltransferase involved in cell wall biosynthesis